MATTAESWDALHQTERLAILNNIYLPTAGYDTAEFSRLPYDELPDEVRNDLHYLTWRK